MESNLPYFRFGKRYELPLLIQSIVMNVTMFVMIHLCVNVRKKNQIVRSRERIFTGWYANNLYYLFLVEIKTT